jgi:hypothetical protein
MALLPWLATTSCAICNCGERNCDGNPVGELYNVCRQVVFYLGAFDEYEIALLVVADASEGHVFKRALTETLNPEIERRLGPDTGIYLIAPALRQ